MNPAKPVSMTNERKANAMTVTNSPERQRRIAELWSARPGMTETEVADQIDADLGVEAEAEAEGQARAEEFSRSFAAMTTCAVPGCPHGKLARTALCETHSAVLYLVEAETAAGETLPDGRRVGDWISELAARRRA
jgi:hypothetical protein